MERLDGCAVLGLEREEDAAGEAALRRLTVGSGDDQLIGPEEAVAFTGDRYIEHTQRCLVEATTGGEVSNDELEMVDRPTAVGFLRFDAGFRSPFKSVLPSDNAVALQKSLVVS